MDTVSFSETLVCSYGFTTIQKDNTDIFTAVRTSDLTDLFFFLKTFILFKIFLNKKSQCLTEINIIL
jgi:hypothetical protein